MDRAIGSYSTRTCRRGEAREGEGGGGERLRGLREAGQTLDKRDHGRDTKLAAQNVTGTTSGQRGNAIKVDYMQNKRCHGSPIFSRSSFNPGRNLAGFLNI